MDFEGAAETAAGGVPTPTELAAPFMRRAELDDICRALNSDNCSAVMVRYDTGLGASTLLRHLAQQLQTSRTVLTIHGTPSLGSVPYGALAPLLHPVPNKDVDQRTGVLRALLAALPPKAPFQSTHAPLVIVDDAHAIDPATADLLVALVLSGTVKVVATHHRAITLPDPLPELWNSGRAESIELFPLTRDDSHKYCQTMLIAPISRAASWHLWTRSVGNPLLLSLLLREALEEGSLFKRSGVWEYAAGRHQSGPGLIEAVERQIRGLSTAGKHALDIVALAEPVAGSVVEQVCGKAAVRELLGRRLVLRPAVDDAELTLASPIYGEVIRQLVPRAQRRILHDRLMENLVSVPMGAEAVVRRAGWAVAVGLEISSQRLIHAALLACKILQPTAALDLLAHVPDDDMALQGRAVMARALYLVDERSDAARLLNERFGEDGSLDALLFDSLLRALTKLALGTSVDAVDGDLDKFVVAGERLAERMPEQGHCIQVNVGHRAMLLKLLVLSHQGQYPAMNPYLEALAHQPEEIKGKVYRTNAAFALAMGAERLCAMGRGSEGHLRFAQAFAVGHLEHAEVLHAREFIIFRQLAAALATGDLTLAAAVLDLVATKKGLDVGTVWGWSGVARGMGILRQGLPAEALGILLPALEALRVSDPHQLIGVCISMAAYAAARINRMDLAEALIAEHWEKSAPFLVLAHERTYLAGARELVLADGSGISALGELAKDCRSQQASLLELNALAMAAEVGETSVVERLISLAPGVEGEWAQAISGFARQILPSAGKNPQPRSAAGLVQAPALPRHEAPWFNKARSLTSAVDFSAKLLASSAAAAVAATSSARRTSSVRLTGREREIATLAVRGFSDKAIADELSLSTRTVEGHVYRCYAKLGIAGRDNLSMDLLG